MRTIIASIAIATCLVATPAPAKTSCAAFVIPLDRTVRASDARLIRANHQAVRAANIAYVLAAAGWRLVWATPDNAERGVYFFHRTGRSGYRLIETWGGVIAPDERDDTVAWARRLKGGGPPTALAGCFADALVAGN